MAWVALIGPELEENLSLRYLASSLRVAGVRSKILAFDRRTDLPGLLRAVLDADDPPCVVGISLAFQWRAVEMMALVMGLREGGYAGHITVGGHFATFACKELLQDFAELDSVVRQEGEETIVALVHAIEHGTSLREIDGLAVRGDDGAPVLTPKRAAPDLRSIPPPDREGPPRRCFGHALAPLISSRGCYANCSFCCIAAWQEQVLPGKRYRLRPVEDVADEMVALQRERGVDLFVFHDDNFFVPSHKKNLERIGALADALEQRGIGPFATVVKARPCDVEPESFRVLRDRLNTIRVYVGIETDADQGLVTLDRRIASRENHEALRILRELDLFACFNMLIFDPDTTMRSLERNVAFMESASDFSFNFCRTELYAGTPLLQRMLAEGRTTGDWLHYDYRLKTPQVQRTFELAIEAFTPRNFGGHALHNDMGGWRLQLETARHFHRDVFDPEWRRAMTALHRRVGADTVAGLRAILAHVRSEEDRSRDAAFVRELGVGLRGFEAEIRHEWSQLYTQMVAACATSQPNPVSIGVDATPLQDQRSIAELHYV